MASSMLGQDAVRMLPPRLLLVAALSACAAQQLRTSIAPETATAPLRIETDAPSTEPAEVTAELRGPTRVRYVPALLAAAQPTIRVDVRNRSTQPIDVSDLRVRLTATRDGVPFPCAAEVGPSDRERARNSVPAGGSATFDRALDCALPLVGTYTVGVIVAFGRTGSWSKGRPVRTLALNVVAARNEPRPVESVPGLWAAFGTESLVGSTSRDASGRLAVILVNGSSGAVEVPRLRLGLRVFRAGGPIPCEDAPLTLKTPSSMAAGRSYVETLDVSCLGLGVPGDYQIAARLLVSNGLGSETEHELGHIHVEVSSDPARLDPSRGLPPSR